jgi:hypothetical protein
MPVSPRFLRNSKFKPTDIYSARGQVKSEETFLIRGRQEWLAR